jgi:peptidoglycan/xylan/chitin deacetylase (PgdA/CDA1 family)
MRVIPAKTPDFVKSLFPNFVWTIPTQGKSIFLTFDDGPTPGITPWVLDTLDHYDAKATFFCIGNNIAKQPEVFQSIINRGHTIGNHTYNHLKGWKTRTKIYLNDVHKTSALIHSHRSNLDLKRSEEHIGILPESKLFRPPYGKFKSKQAKALQSLGFKIILWDVLSFDWDPAVSEEQCLKNVKHSTREGSIIVFHDSVKASKNLKFVLPKVLEHYNELGYAFKAIPL